MSRMTNNQRKSIVTLSVGSWIKAQREGDLKATLASKLIENGYSNAAYSVSKRIINALKDENAIHVAKSGQLTLKRKLDAEYIGKLCDRLFYKTTKPSGSLPIVSESNRFSSFKDEELVSELRARGWIVKCEKTQIIKLWFASLFPEFIIKMVNSGFIISWN